MKSLRWGFLYTFAFILCFLLYGCVKHSKNEYTTVDSSQQKLAPPPAGSMESAIAEPQNGKDELDDVNADREYPLYFKPILSFPKIDDTIAFLSTLRQSLHLEAPDDPMNSVNYYKKVHLYGSSKDYILLEFDFHDGPESGYPWKNQFLFDTCGKLIAKFWAKYLKLVNIVPNQPPMLLGLFATGHGNGWHRVFVMGGDSLEDVYDGFLAKNDSDYFKTYDAAGDGHINRPYELRPSFEDLNGDGIKDIIFTGERIYFFDYPEHTLPSSSIDGPFKVSKNVRYVLIYNPRTGHFEPDSKTRRAFKEQY